MKYLFAGIGTLVGAVFTWAYLDTKPDTLKIKFDESTNSMTPEQLLQGLIKMGVDPSTAKQTTATVAALRAGVPLAVVQASSKAPAPLTREQIRELMINAGLPVGAPEKV